MCVSGHVAGLGASWCCLRALHVGIASGSTLARRPRLFAFGDASRSPVGGVLAVLVTGRAVKLRVAGRVRDPVRVATRNGILLVAHYRPPLAEGAPFGEAVVRGSLERISPILMTALTAGLALIPLAFGGGEPAMSCRRRWRLRSSGG